MSLSGGIPFRSSWQLNTLEHFQLGSILDCRRVYYISVWCSSSDTWNFKETSYYILYHWCIVTPSASLTADQCHWVRKTLGWWANFSPSIGASLLWTRGPVDPCVLLQFLPYIAPKFGPTFKLQHFLRIQWTSTERFALRLVTDEVMVLDGQKLQVLSRIQVQHLSQLMISPSFTAEARRWRWEMGDELFLLLAISMWFYIIYCTDSYTGILFGNVQVWELAITNKNLFGIRDWWPKVALMKGQSSLTSSI